jgi:hypothetical protein
MVGQQIAEGRGKRTGRRVICTEPKFKVEATVEEMAKFLGVDGMNIITYVACTKPDSSLEGQGEGVFASLQGDIVTWRGLGVGRFGEGGSVQYRGCLSFTTTSEKLGTLNGMTGVFQFDIDAQGNTHSQTWEMTAAAGNVAAAA